MQQPLQRQPGEEEEQQAHAERGDDHRQRYDPPQFFPACRPVDLHVLGQAKLAHALFPVGAYQKEEVRALARRFNLPVASKHDSQDLCFVSDGDHRRFLRDHGQQAGRDPAPGLPQPGGVTLIDTEHPVTSSGTLDLWRATSAQGARVMLKVFRPEGNRLVLIGTSSLETVAAGEVATFSCKIPVARNDLIGCYCPDSSCVDAFTDGTTLAGDGDEPAGYSHDPDVTASFSVTDNLDGPGFLAALLAALMSTVDTLINGCAAIGVNDLYRRFIKKNESEAHYVRVTKLMVIGLMV